MGFFKKLKERFLRAFSNEIGIDLGTANTLVYVRGKGIVINEPTVVAVNQKTGRVVAIGRDAKRMLGRTPAHITAIRPLVDGVISDYEVAEEMLSYFMHKAQEGSRKLFGPRVVVGVPSGITNVECRAVRDAVVGAGAREVYVVEEPMATALGIRLPVADSVCSMVIDMGGGTTDIAILTLGGVVNSRSINIAGDRLNRDIIAYARDKFQLLIGEQTAEELKAALGSVLAEQNTVETRIRGRDLISGLPREVVVTDTDVREAISPSIQALTEVVQELLETTPPEVVGEIIQRGIHVAGGTALLRGFDKLLADILKVPVYVVDDPLTPVARGTGMVLEDFNRYRDLILREEHELPPR